MLMNWRI